MRYQEGPRVWTEKAGQKEYDGDERWLGGYFAAEYGGYFFGDNDGGCGLKAYTLTSQATTPDRLPIADIPNQNNDPALERIIQEAIEPEPLSGDLAKKSARVPLRMAARCSSASIAEALAFGGLERCSALRLVPFATGLDAALD